LVLFVSCDFTSNLHKDILIAQDYTEEGDYLEATEKYKSILQENLKQSIKTRITYQLGNIYLIHLKRPEIAAQYFKQIVEADKTPLWQVKALEKYADISYEFLKNYKVAYSAYQQLNSFIPKLKRTEEYSYKIGMCLFELGQYTAARKVFLDITSDRNHSYFVRSHFFVGKIHFLKREWNTAISFFKKYLLLESNKLHSVETKFLIANSYEMLEKLSTAYKIYASIQEQYPNYEVIKNRIKSLYERRVSRKR
jgi:tetratricopeptide (TPR) repeat protein